MDNPETRATLGTQDTWEDKTKNRTKHKKQQINVILETQGAY
jgi:hypothetical protein